MLSSSAELVPYWEQTPQELQRQPQAAATLSPAVALEYRPVVLPRLPERSRPDPLTAAPLRRRRQRAEPRSCRPRNGDRLFRFEALEIKELSHRLDGVLWPRECTGCAETGSPEFPVVLLEVQMHPDPVLHHTRAVQVWLAEVRQEGEAAR